MSEVPSPRALAAAAAPARSASTRKPAVPNTAAPATKVQVPIAGLPKIARVLEVDCRPYFVVIAYPAFVGFAARAWPTGSPEVLTFLDDGGEHRFVVMLMSAYRAALGALEVTGEIDERHYLRRHEDVRSGIKAEIVESATRHYIVQGYFEERDVRFPEPRPQRVPSSAD